VSARAARDRKARDRRLPVALRPARQQKDPALRRAQRGPRRPGTRGGFQTIQGRIAPGSERGTAGLAAKGLDRLSLTMLAISNQSVHSSVSDAKVRALMVRTGESLGVHPLGCATAAFHLTPRTHRNRCWPSTRRGRGGETTEGAIMWTAGLEQTVELAAYLGSCFRRGWTKSGPAQSPQQREREDEEEHEQEHLMVHTNPLGLK
jgi:hypothetical protein